MVKIPIHQACDTPEPIRVTQHLGYGERVKPLQGIPTQMIGRSNRAERSEERGADTDEAIVRVRRIESPMRLPDRPSREAAVLEALEWSTQQWRRSMTIFLRESGLRDDELLAPPLRNETVNLAYCPRCQEQFIALDTVCADCGDRKTVPWPAEANPQASVNHPAVRQL